MDQRKPGERPDTMHLQNLPTRWFVNQQDRSGAAGDRPSELVLKRVFGTFGDIRAVDIPMLDPYRWVVEDRLTLIYNTIESRFFVLLDHAINVVLTIL